jgi:DNA repair photolyase
MPAPSVDDRVKLGVASPRWSPFRIRMTIIGSVGGVLAVAAAIFSWYTVYSIDRVERIREQRLREGLARADRAFEKTFEKYRKELQVAVAASRQLPAIRRDLESPRPGVRKSAVERIDKLGPNAGLALEPLVKAIDDSDTEVRAAAKKALRNFLLLVKAHYLGEEPMGAFLKRSMNNPIPDGPPAVVAKYHAARQYAQKRYRDSAALLATKYVEAAELAGKCGDSELQKHFEARAAKWKKVAKGASQK